MKINKEEFNKLSQLDRIEFRQRYNECGLSISIGNILWYMLIIATILLVGGLKTEFISIINLVIYLIFIEFGLLIICPIVTITRQNKIIQEYFKVEVKKK